MESRIVIKSSLELLKREQLSKVELKVLSATCEGLILVCGQLGLVRPRTMGKGIGIISRVNVPISDLLYNLVILRTDIYQVICVYMYTCCCL